MNIKDLTAKDLEGTVIAFHDNTVVAEKDGRTGTAKCNPVDTYNAQLGVGVALGRLFDDRNFSPKEGEMYWSIDDCCLQKYSEIVLSYSSFSALSVLDVLRRKLNICYKTKEAAMKHSTEDVAKLKNYLKLDGE